VRLNVLSHQLEINHLLESRLTETLRTGVVATLVVRDELLGSLQRPVGSREGEVTKEWPIVFLFVPVLEVAYELVGVVVRRVPVVWKGFQVVLVLHVHGDVTGLHESRHLGLSAVSANNAPYPTHDPGGRYA
jgi:hypothetical protein